MDSDRKPDWEYWNACETLEVWEAVALSLDREPRSIIDLRERRSIRQSGPIRLFDGGPNFDKRLELLRRAFDLDASRFVPANDYYGAFGLFESRAVLPSKVGQFFVDKGFPVPPEWTAAIGAEQPKRTNKVTETAPAWREAARRIATEIWRKNPKKNLKWLAGEVSNRMKAEGIRGRGNKALDAETILRHGIQGLERP